MSNHNLEQESLTRRSWLKVVGAATVGASCAARLPAAPENKKPSMSIGILMGTFARPTLEARLDAVRQYELECAQLNFGCAGLLMMPEAIPTELLERIRRESDARGVKISSLEGTFNMSHPDANHRREGLRRLRVMAEACEPLETRYIHLCTGTRDPRNMWRRHPDNNSPKAWRDMISCFREAARIAEQTDTVLAFEPEVNNVVDSAQKARRLMDEVGSSRVRVTIDGANIFHAGELARMNEVLDEAFALIGKDIVLAHAKDLDHDGDAGHLAAGHGKLNYDRYLTLLHQSGFCGPLLLHGLSETQVPGCVKFLRDTLARVTKLG